MDSLFAIFLYQFSSVIIASLLFFLIACIAFISIKKVAKNLITQQNYFIILILIFITGIFHFLYIIVTTNFEQTTNCNFQITTIFPNTIVFNLLIVISFVYIICSVFILLQLSISFFKNINASQKILQLPYDAFQYFTEICAFYNIKMPKIVTKASVVVPYTKGFFKKVIILPIAFVNQFTYQEMEVIILHELAHIKRGDHYWNIILYISKVLFAGNPFAHILLKQAVLEREIACDNWVLQQQITPKNYAQVLYKAASFATQKNNLLLQFTATNQTLLYRIKNLFNDTQESYKLNYKSLFIIFITTLLALQITTPKILALQQNAIVSTHFNFIKNKSIVKHKNTITPIPNTINNNSKIITTKNYTTINEIEAIKKTENLVILASQKIVETPEKAYAVAIQSNFMRIDNTVFDVYDTIQIMQQKMEVEAVKNLTQTTLEQLMQKALSVKSNDYNSFSTQQIIPLKVLQNGTQNFYYKDAFLQYKTDFDENLQQWNIQFAIKNNQQIIAKQNVKFVVQKVLHQVNL